MQNDDLIVVRTFATEAEADVAASALEAAEIDAMIQADTAGGMRPHIAGPQGGSRCWCTGEPPNQALHHDRGRILFRAPPRRCAGPGG